MHGKWVNCKVEQPPTTKVFDVWQEWFDGDTGESLGRRITNCWMRDNRVCAARGDGSTVTEILSVTHWMAVPEAPPE